MLGLVLTHLPRAGGAGHRQHLSPPQLQADVPQHRRDVEVGEEEVAARLVLLLDLLEQLADALQEGEGSGAVWLYRSLCCMCYSCILSPDHQGATLNL